MFSTTASAAGTEACRTHQKQAARHRPASPAPLSYRSILHYDRGITRRKHSIYHRLWAEPSFLPTLHPGPGQEDGTTP